MLLIEPLFFNCREDVNVLMQGHLPDCARASYHDQTTVHKYVRRGTLVAVGIERDGW